jgi:hypothetical protein
MKKIDEYLSTKMSKTYENCVDSIVEFLQTNFGCELISIDENENTILLTNTDKINNFIHDQINDNIDNVKYEKKVRLFKRFIRKNENNAPYNGMFIFVYASATDYLCRIGQIFDTYDDEKKIEINYTNLSALSLLKDILNKLLEK